MRAVAVPLVYDAPAKRCGALGAERVPSVRISSIGAFRMKSDHLEGIASASTTGCTSRRTDTCSRRQQARGGEGAHLHSWGTGQSRWAAGGGEGQKGEAEQWGERIKEERMKGCSRQPKRHALGPFVRPGACVA